MGVEDYFQRGDEALKCGNALEAAVVIKWVIGAYVDQMPTIKEGLHLYEHGAPPSYVRCTDDEVLEDLGKVLRRARAYRELQRAETGPKEE